MDPAHQARLRAHGHLSTALILGGLTTLLAVIGAVLAGPDGVLLALVVAAAPMLFNPMNAPDTVLRLQGARPIPRWQAPGLYEACAGLARRAGLARPPALYLIDNPTLNALTVGSTRRSAIAVTDGLLRHLPAPEVSAVLAHEIAHLQHHDLWLLGVADSFGRMTEWLSLLGQWLVLLSLPLQVFGGVAIAWPTLLVLVFAPLLSALLRLALSRTREYEADLGAAELLGSPRPLASALARMERTHRRLLPWLLPSGRLEQAPDWLQTHPSTATRIARLLALEEGR